MSQIRSFLRRAFRFWQPAQEALKRAKRAWPGPRGRKWGFVCAHCGETFIRAQVEIHHTEEVGSLKTLDELPDFVRRLTPEDPAAYQVLCKKCHKLETHG